jgi:hypothetical protein
MPSPSFLKQAGLWCLSVLLVAFFAFYLGVNTAECRLSEFSEFSESVVATTTGRFIQRVGGSGVRYSFVANGKTFTAVGLFRDKPIESIEAGSPLGVSYDSGNPSVSSVLVASEMLDECNYEQAPACFFIVFLCSILGIAARGSLTFRKRQRPVLARIPTAAAVAGEMQNLAALATAACLFWILDNRLTDIHDFPGSFVLAAILLIATIVFISILPILWAGSAALGLWSGSRLGWLASIVGDAICLGLLIWCGMRGPLGIAVSAALLGTPITLLFLPQVARFYLTAIREDAPAQ